MRYIALACTHIDRQAPSQSISITNSLTLLPDFATELRSIYTLHCVLCVCATVNSNELHCNASAVVIFFAASASVVFMVWVFMIHFHVDSHSCSHCVEFQLRVA